MRTKLIPFIGHTSLSINHTPDWSLGSCSDAAGLTLSLSTNGNIESRLKVWTKRFTCITDPWCWTSHCKLLRIQGVFDNIDNY